MREILYKAKRIDNGEFITGFYVRCREHDYILPIFNACALYYGYDDSDDFIEVDQNTICQYTGLTDKNGQKIWENDILVTHLDEQYPEDETYEQVIWENSGFCTKENGSDDREPLDDFTTQNYAVAGNIFDNAELLENK